MEKKELTTTEVAEILNVSQETLRNWDISGKLKPTWTTEGGHRRYSIDDIEKITKTAGLEVVDYGEPHVQSLDNLFQTLKETIIKNNRSQRLIEYGKKIDILSSHIKNRIFEVAKNNNNHVFNINMLSGIPINLPLLGYELLDKYTRGLSVTINISKLSANTWFVFGIQEADCSLLTVTQFNNVPSEFKKPESQWKRLLTFSPEYSKQYVVEIDNYFKSVVVDTIKSLIDINSTTK